MRTALPSSGILSNLIEPICDTIFYTINKTTIWHHRQFFGAGACSRDRCAVADTDLTVMITGESGTGKEIFSQIIHSLSKRKHNKLIAVNCGAIPPVPSIQNYLDMKKDRLPEPTGERKGYFETADGGTIFLDEIGEMPLDTQAYLLRILESGGFLRVGHPKHCIPMFG